MASISSGIVQLGALAYRALRNRFAIGKISPEISKFQTQNSTPSS
jgi:hypothetical protein